MAFTKALYYPSIDIKDEGWLKNAMLYWEQVQTIVPLSIEQPYATRTAREFNDEGLLVPLYVKSDMEEIEELTDEVLKYLETQEGMEVLMAQEISEHYPIHSDKLPYEIQELVGIHPDKLSHEIRRRIERIPWGKKGGDWLNVDLRFAEFYMTLLATHLSEGTGSGLLTESPTNNRLSTSVRLGGNLPIARSRRYRYDHYHHGARPVSLSQGLLADLILEKIKIDPNTSAKAIIEFRKEHSDELGYFRTKVAELTEAISNNQNFDALQQQLEDIYVNEVKPAIGSLKRTLTDSKIRWATENFLKVAFFSAGTTSVPLALVGLSVPHALLVGVGVSMTASAIMYNREKADKLRRNPFSYLLAAEKAFA